MHDKINSHAYDTIDNPPGPIMHGQMGSHAYHTLENPSGVIMHRQMGSHAYHTLENPSGVIMHGQMGSHAYHTLENPTNPSGQVMHDSFCNRLVYHVTSMFTSFSCNFLIKFFNMFISLII